MGTDEYLPDQQRVRKRRKAKHLFWPFSNFRFKLLIPSPIDYSWSTTSLSATALDLVKISLKELIIFAPVVSVVLWLKRPNGGAQISRMFNFLN